MKKKKNKKGNTEILNLNKQLCSALEERLGQVSNVNIEEIPKVNKLLQLIFKFYDKRHEMKKEKFNKKMNKFVSKINKITVKYHFKGENMKKLNDQMDSLFSKEELDLLERHQNRADYWFEIDEDR